MKFDIHLRVDDDGDALVSKELLVTLRRLVKVLERLLPPASNPPVSGFITISNIKEQ